MGERSQKKFVYVIVSADHLKGDLMETLPPCLEEEMRESLLTHFMSLLETDQSRMDRFGICGCTIHSDNGLLHCVFYFSNESYNTNEGIEKLKRDLASVVDLHTPNFGIVKTPVLYEFVGKIVAQ